MQKLINTISDNFPLILSTIISLVAIVATMYQTHVARKTKIIDLYFSAQLKAYQELFLAIGHLDQNFSSENYSAFLSASQNAMLVSTNRNAEVINNFGAVYIDYLESQRKEKMTDELKAEFKNSKDCLTILLRNEIFRFDTVKRKSDKYFKDKHRNKYAKQKTCKYVQKPTEHI